MTNQRFIVLAFLTLGGLLGLTVRGLGLPLLAAIEVADPLIFGMVNASSLVALVISATAFFVLLRNSTAYRFADEAIEELRKTTWPDREETIRSSGVVIATTVVIAATLATYDVVWAAVTGFFLFTEG